MKHFSLSSFVIALSVAALLSAVPALAQGTTTFEYDALGRLIGTATAGGTNDGLNTDYEYDPAGNRQRVVVTGSSNDEPPGGTTVIVLPINGFLVIPIPTSN